MDDLSILGDLCSIWSEVRNYRMGCTVLKIALRWVIDVGNRYDGLPSCVAISQT